MATHVQLKGTFYEVGKELGQLQRSNIRAIVDHLKQSEFYSKVEEYRASEEGAVVYTRLEDTAVEHCADYVDELKGIADGADVEYDDLFLLNVGPDLTAAIGLVPDGSHGVRYAAIFAGCTNIILQTDVNEGLFVHTEDIDPFYTDKTLVISVEIVDAAGLLLEKWTEYTVPGELSGSKFGFNCHGVMFAHNNIYLKGINKYGIPRRFMNRKLMTIRDLSEAKDILSKGPGISSAFTYIFMKRNPTTGSVDTAVVETAGTHTGPRVVQIRPPSIYHHCNIWQRMYVSTLKGVTRRRAPYNALLPILSTSTEISRYIYGCQTRHGGELRTRLQHMPHECHPEESSVHRAAVISQYINRGELRTGEHLKQIVADQRDTVFPVYRTGEYPDYLQTGASGLFDARSGTMEIYLNKPGTTSPHHVLQVGKTF